MTTPKEAALAFSKAGGMDEEPGQKVSQATKLVELADDFELWHTPDQSPYATIKKGESFEHMQITTAVKSGIKPLLSYRYFKTHGETPNASALSDAVTQLIGRAQHDGQEHPIYTRIAEVDDGRPTIYLDLADADRNIVEVDEFGWTVIKDAPVRFIRPPGVEPLPLPSNPGSGDFTRLRELLNLGSDSDSAWSLVAGWLTQALRGHGPYPLLVILGEHGSAKTTAAKMLRRLVDPNKVDLGAPPKDDRDLLIQAKNSWAVAFDNLSSIPEWLSNALCRLATGGGLRTRALYSDDAETLFGSQRPTILNGIEEFVNRPDLSDRAIFLNLPSIPEERRKIDVEIWEDFNKLQPVIFSGLLDALVTGLHNEKATILPWPRMAGFARMGAASEPAYGVPIGTFITAYQENRSEGNKLALEQEVLVPFIERIVDAEPDGRWWGTATELLEKLDSLVEDSQRRLSSWPKKATALSNRLKVITPNLRNIGIEVERIRKNNERIISIQKVKGSDLTVTTVQAVTSGVINPSLGDDGDGRDGQKPLLKEMEMEMERLVNQNEH